MNKCHELMNAGLKSHRTKTNDGIREAICKYQEALKHVPERGTLSYPGTGHRVAGGNHIRSEIFTHLGYAYHDLGEPYNANKAYADALECNPNNQDAKHDRRLPHGLRARLDNQGASGGVVKYEKGGSLCSVIITETGAENYPKYGRN